MSRTVLIMVGTFLLCTHALAEERLSYLGIATDEDGKIVYREKHMNVFEDGQIRSSMTRYYDPQGKLIAKLSSDYRYGASLPAYRFEDFRNGLEEGVRRSESTVTVFSREKYDAPMKRKSFSVKKDMKAGQGLHHFIRENLASLVTKDEVSVEFLIPNRLDHYDFVIEPTRKSKEKVSFRLEVDSWLLNIFADSLTFTYDRESKHLLYYHGPSNLVDDEGDAQKVSIRYLYPQSKLATGASASKGSQS